MKPIFIFSGLLTVLVLGSCRQTMTPSPGTDPVINMAWFNQRNTTFRGAAVNKLTNFWYSRRSDQPVEFAIISDQATYQRFFRQSTADSLPYIDFTSNSLLIGVRGSYGMFRDGPANIRSIEQSTEQQPSGEVIHKVTVRARSRGEEWFGFTTLIPRLLNPNEVKLQMSYQYD